MTLFLDEDSYPTNSTKHDMREALNEESFDDSSVSEHQTETLADVTIESVNLDIDAADGDLDKAVVKLGGTGYVPIFILDYKFPSVHFIS